MSEAPGNPVCATLLTSTTFRPDKQHWRRGNSAQAWACLKDKFIIYCRVLTASLLAGLKGKITGSGEPARLAPFLTGTNSRVPAGERETFPDGPRSSDTAASLADSVGGTHSCHSIPIEHRNDPLLAWPARRNSHTASRSTDELRILRLAVSHI